MDLRKRSAPQKVEGLGKIFFRLAGESGDEVGRDGAAREVLAQKTAREQKTLGVVSPSHGAQGFVTAALQRKMKMRTQIFVRLQGLAEGFGHSARLE